jgi:hypothetical protein
MIIIEWEDYLPSVGDPPREGLKTNPLKCWRISDFLFRALVKASKD